jgi:hypothetical protein
MQVAAIFRAQKVKIDNDKRPFSRHNGAKPFARRPHTPRFRFKHTGGSAE